MKKAVYTVIEVIVMALSFLISEYVVVSMLTRNMENKFGLPIPQTFKDYLVTIAPMLLLSVGLALIALAVRSIFRKGGELKFYLRAAWIAAMVIALVAVSYAYVQKFSLDLIGPMIPLFLGAGICRYTREDKL